MLEFLWLLFRSICQKFKPEEILSEGVPKAQIDKCSFNILSSVSNFSKDGKSQNEKSLDREQTCGRLRFKENLEVVHLSNQSLFYTSKNFLLERKILLKCFPENMNCDILSGTAGSKLEESSNVSRELVVCSRESELTTSKVCSVKDVQVYINNLIQHDRRKSFFESESHCPGLYNGKQTTLKPHFVLINSTDPKCFPPQPQELTIYNKQMKLNYNQIVTIWVTACYIKKYLDTEEKYHTAKAVGDEIKKSYYFVIDNDTLDLVISQPTNYKESNVIITELDSTDEMDTVQENTTQRMKSNMEKCRKSKVNNKNVESSVVPVSSTLSFESLFFFESINQGLTQSKVILEIEKGFKPIKDQISELQKSITNFAIINSTKFVKGVDISRLSVNPVVRSAHKVRSILTVPCTSFQRLARLSDICDKVQENCCPEVSIGEPKKLSPLAEMYIKLSRQ